MADAIVPADRDKSLYLTQIRFLDEELERCQLRCDELKKQINDLTFLYGAMERDRDDIYDYLIRSSNAVEMRVKELSEVLACQQQADKKETDALQLHLNQQKEELQKEVDKLKSKNMKHKEKLEQHQKEREKMMKQLAHLESIEKQLVAKREEHEAAIVRLKKQINLEDAKVFQDTKKQVQSSIKNKVLATVKEERSQHREVSEKAQEFAEENGKLLKETAALRYNESKLCFEMKKMKRDLHVVTQDIFRLKTEAEQLSQTCQQLTVQLNNCSRRRGLLMATEQDLRHQLTSKSEQCCQKTAEAAQLEAELQEEMSRRRQLEADMQKAANILRPTAMGLEKVSEAQWKIQKLREILESNASHGTESTLFGSPEKSNRGQKPQTSGPRPVSTETLNFATDPLFLLARYRRGDLGFVPRPTWKSKGAVYGADAQSTSQLPFHRKLCSHKTSITASDNRSDPSDPASQDTHAEARTSNSALLNPNLAIK